MAKRGLSSEEAREVRKKGHDDSLEFALLMGLNSDYKNGNKAKKDVIDPSGDTHSVKSGEIKWQLFLYGRERFMKDDFFQTMDGIGQQLIECIDAFPKNITDYEINKGLAKEKCREPMRNLKDLFQEKRRIRTFINKAIFNGGEVNYWTIKDNGKFHVFLNTDVVKLFADSVTVENSQARAKNQVPEQKVIFKYNGLNLAELEMRNDSKVHYRQIRFNMLKKRMMALLYSNIPVKGQLNENVIIYGEAIKKFGKWV